MGAFKELLIIAMDLADETLTEILEVLSCTGDQENEVADQLTFNVE